MGNRKTEKERVISVNEMPWLDQIRKINSTMVSIQPAIRRIRDQISNINKITELNKDLLTRQMEAIYVNRDKYALIKKSIDINSLTDTISQINESLKKLFEENRYLTSKQIAMLKECDFKKTFFDAIPANIPTIVKNIRIPTIKFLEENKNIKLNVEEKAFVYKDVYLTTNQVNEIAVMANVGTEFTPDFMIKLMKSFEKNGAHYVETDEYKKLLEYLRETPVFVKVVNNEFFRGIKNDTGIYFDEARMRNSEFGYPKMGRFNFPGANYLYVSDKKIGPKYELLLHNDTNDFNVQLASFKNDKEIDMFDVDNKRLDSVLKKQLKLKLCDKDKAIPNEYVISAILSDCIKHYQLAEGIKYSGNGYNNYVLYNTGLFEYTNLGIYNINDIN